jgi:general L-amino acid transport system substrate-binding protein
MKCKRKLVPQPFLIACLVLGASTIALAGPTLDKIKAHNSLPCGINTEEPEYSTEDAHGNHAAFDMDICKAIAVAVLGPDAKFTVTPYRDERDARKALQSGEIAVLATGSANYLNTTNAGLGLARPVFYDYQGFLVNKTMAIGSPHDLAGKKICFLSGTEIEDQLTSYMNRAQIKWLPFPFQEEGEMEAAFITRNCAAITADVSQLAYERIAFKAMSKDFEILPDVIAKDPLAPMYRMDDPQWAAIVNWTIEALIQAEESGITQANIGAESRSGDVAAQRLFGRSGGYGQYLALRDSWAAQVIQAVGNYGEIFNRDLGSKSAMKLERGANNLWTHDGLMYATPIR